MARRSLLMVTLPPFQGGVPAKAALLARHLRGLGWDVHVAYYATLSDHPELVAPSWRLLSGTRPGRLDGTCWDDFPCHAIGCRLPELEAPYTRATPAWKKLIGDFDRHVAVGGNPLVSNLLVEAGVPHLLWCAAPVLEDRAARAAAMAWPRRFLDRMLVVPALLEQQRRVLASPLCHVLGVSRYTCRTLGQLGAADPLWLPIPTDLERFSPPASPAPAGTIGFAGRLGDPRKRVDLLLQAVAHLRRSGRDVRLRLAGEAPPALTGTIRALGLEDRVEVLGHMPAEQLPDFYRGLDVFALPSSQEGLGIVGVEAMACGVPVVTATRGSGPDDYVVEGVTGHFTDATAEALAAGLAAAVDDRNHRAALSTSARVLATERYGHAAFAELFAAAWSRRWGDRP